MTWTIRVKICPADDPDCKSPQVRSIPGGIAKPDPPLVVKRAREYAADYGMRVCEVLKLEEDPTFIEEHGASVIGAVGTVVLIVVWLW